MFGYIFSDRRISFVHRVFRCYEGNDTTSSYFIQCLCKIVIMDIEIKFIISFIRYLELSKWNVTDGNIEETIRKICVFVSIYRDIGFLIQLFGNSSCYRIQFDSIQFRILHLLRQSSQEVTSPTSWLQYISILESKIVQSRIDGINHDRWSIEGCQCRLSCLCIFFIIK